MRKKFSQICIAIVAILVIAASCSEHKGFKKEKESGIYYKFYVQSDTTDQVKDGDVVTIDFVIRTTDTVLLKNVIYLPMEEMQYSDLLAALKMMHKGDSATFIFPSDTLDQETFYQFILQQQNELKGKDLYFDVKILDIIPKAKVDEMKQEQQQQMEIMLEKLKSEEDSLRQVCLKATGITSKPTESGLYFMTKKAGKGAMPSVGQSVSVHYTGKLPNGEVFDSSISRGEPITFVLGQGSVIQGWEEAIAKMKVGEKAVVVIPSHLAYGDRGAGGVIPPYTPLIFEVELMDVQ